MSRLRAGGESELSLLFFLSRYLCPRAGSSPIVADRVVSALTAYIPCSSTHIIKSCLPGSPGSRAYYYYNSARRFRPDATATFPTYTSVSYPITESALRDLHVGASACFRAHSPIDCVLCEPRRGSRCESPHWSSYPTKFTAPTEFTAPPSQQPPQHPLSRPPSRQPSRPPHCPRSRQPSRPPYRPPWRRPWLRPWRPCAPPSP